MDLYNSYILNCTAYFHLSKLFEDHFWKFLIKSRDMLMSLHAIEENSLNCKRLLSKSCENCIISNRGILHATVRSLEAFIVSMMFFCLYCPSLIFVSLLFYQWMHEQISTLRYTDSDGQICLILIVRFLCHSNYSAIVLTWNVLQKMFLFNEIFIKFFDREIMVRPPKDAK